MAKRKAIPVSQRFEIFKRDRFTCQYCGKKSPDVVLEIDHIIPVSEGGTNEMVNLITSCFECNRGKGKRKLDDHTVIEKQRLELEQMAERQEQIAMMAKWRKEMTDLNNSLVEYLCDYWVSLTGYEITDEWYRIMNSYFRRFGFDEVQEAIGISVDYYFQENRYSANEAFRKIGGICYNRKINREKGSNDGSI